MSATDLFKLPEKELIQQLAQKDNKGRSYAMEAFYERHKHYVYHISKRFALQLGASLSVEDLVHQVFYIAYNEASIFAIQITQKNHEDPSLLVREWLSRITQRTFKQFIRHWLNAGQLDDNFSLLDQQKDFEDKSPRLMLIEQALDTLSDKERIVILFTFQYFNAEKKNQRLPNKEVAELAGMLNVERSSIRKIRQRGLKKINQFLEKNTQPHEA